MEATKTIAPPSFWRFIRRKASRDDEEIAGREDVHVLLPHGELGVLERRGGGDAGVRDEDVDAAIFDRRLGEGARDACFIRYIKNDAANRVRSVR